MSGDMLTVLKDSKFIVGLTGGIGSGKSTVSDLFASKGIDIVDADIVAREVVAPNSEGLKAVAARFGEQVCLNNGQLDRQKLREIVFNNTHAKDDLNAILHPLIRQQMLQQLCDSSSQYCILVAPLLFENNLQGLTDQTLAVDVSVETQLNRTVQRDGGNLDTIKGIIAAQISRDDRTRLADDIIDNNRDVSELTQQVNDLHKKYMQKSRLKLKQ